MNSKIVLLFITVIITLFSCNKEETVSKIGNDILPDGDKLNVKYFVLNDIAAVTVPGKRFVSNNRDIALLGSYNFDSKFGLTKADFISQVRPASLGITFADTIVVDSVKLYLAFNEEKYYGDENTEFRFKIYELNNDIYFDSTYYTDFNPSSIIDINTICDTTFTPNTDGDILSFSLSKEYGQKIIDVYKYDSLASNEDFLNKIKGLYITTDSINFGGSILYIDYKSENSFVKVYCTETKNNVLINTDFEVLLNNYSAEINMFKHTYGDIQFEDTTDYIYAQGMAGAMGKVDLSPVKLFSDTSKVVINKAELIVPNENDITYGSPEKMYIEIIDTTSENNLVKYGYLNDDGTEYSFLVTDHITSIIDEIDNNTGIYIYPADPTINASKVKLINDNDNKNIKIKLTYTKY